MCLYRYSSETNINRVLQSTMNNYNNKKKCIFKTSHRRNRMKGGGEEDTPVKGRIGVMR